MLSGDTPLVTEELLRELVDGHRSAGANVTVLSFELDEPGAYGRIVRDGSGRLAAIVEAQDASPEELRAHRGQQLASTSSPPRRCGRRSTGSIRTTRRESSISPTVSATSSRAAAAATSSLRRARPLALGVNTRVELANAAAVLRDRINEQHMLAGVTIVDPHSTWIEAGVELETDVTIHPFTVIRGDVTVGRGVEIGPFAYVRPGTYADEEAKIGTFVEVKNSRIGARTKIPHLSYVGDADIGEDTNVAAGNITANFPHEKGEGKQRTTIGRNVRTGVDNSFLAPVTIGDNAWVAAGSVITEDVPPDALAIARARQENKEGYAGGKRHD